MFSSKIWSSYGHSHPSASHKQLKTKAGTSVELLIHLDYCNLNASTLSMNVCVSLVKKFSWLECLNSTNFLSTYSKGIESSWSLFCVLTSYFTLFFLSLFPLFNQQVLSVHWCQAFSRYWNVLHQNMFSHLRELLLLCVHRTM